MLPENVALDGVDGAIAVVGGEIFRGDVEGFV